MHIIPLVLQRRSHESALRTEQAIVDTILLTRESMDNDRTVIGINKLYIVRHVSLLFIALRTLFAKVPVQREVMSETSDEFAEV